MIVWIAKINALATFRPAYFAFDRDAVGEQMLFPRAEILSRDGEREVKLARRAVRRNHPAGRRDRIHGPAAPEYEQHLLIGHAKRAEPLTGFEQPQSELLLVEANRAGKIVRAKASFNDSVNSRGGHRRIPCRAERKIPSGVYRGPCWDHNVYIVNFASVGHIMGWSAAGTL